jgi:hypothetical protein
MPSIIRATTTSGLQVAPDNSGSLQLQTNGTNTAVTIDTSQNVGIGTTTPTSSLVVAGAAAGTPTINGVHLGTQSGFATIELVGTSGTGSLIDFTQSGTDSKGRILYSNISDFMGFTTNNAERMRIDSSGSLLINTTSNIALSGRTVPLQILQNNNSQEAITIKANSSTYTFSSINFVNASSSQVGFIYMSASATQFSTSSDYRLKENIVPMTGALDKVALLKPVTYKWKIDGSNGQGFIAHELQEIVPDCVTGEKDAVDADGNPKYQGVDTSFLVATLTAAIQEMKAIIDAQSARIDALENK